MLKYIIFSTIMCCAPLMHILAQGSLRGKVVDKETGEPIIGATIQIKKTNRIGISDLDGNFIISDVAPGVLDVECSYLGYGTQRVLGVQVKDDRVALAYFKLEEGNARELGIDVVVTAEAAKHLEAILLAKRKKSSKFLETLSSEEIFRTGTATAAQAAKNLTGVTVEDNKYIYVRGLGGRYVKVLINGAELAQNILQEGGSNLQIMAPIALDNITLYKNFTGDFTGNFGGGALALNTRSVPDRFFLKADLSIGFNLQSTFNKNYIGFKGGKVDFIGYKDNNWIIPEPTNVLKLGESPNSENEIIENQQNLDLMSKNFDFNNNLAIPNWRLSFAVGNQQKMGKKSRSKWGAYVAYSLSNSHQFYKNGIANRYGRLGVSKDSLVALSSFTDKRAEYATLSTFLVNFTFNFLGKHKIILSANADVNMFRISRELEGDFAERGIVGQQNYLSRSLKMRQDGNQAGQLRGFHQLGSSKRGVSMDWSVSATSNQSFMPNTRYLSYIGDKGGSANSMSDYQIDNYAPPAEFYTQLISIVSNNWVNLNIPITINDKIDSDLKIGSSFLYNFQNLIEQRYYYQNSSTSIANDNLSTYFDQSNYLSWNGNEPSNTGLYLNDGTLAQNNYLGEERVLAAYVSYELDFNKKLKANAGFRYAYTAFSLQNTLGVDSLYIYRNFNQIFPFANLNYYISSDMIVRFAASHTTARPRMRELLPFETFDFVGDYIKVGNPNLQASDIYHIDLRWEFFPRLREVLAGGLFYKYLTNPIALEVKSDQPNHYLQYTNEPNAQLIGLEIEVRKNLDFIGSFAKDFYVNANVAYIHSFSKIPTAKLAAAQAIDPEVPSTMPLVGQAPYIINIGLRYQNDELGTLANVAFNLTGQRLMYIMEDGLANVYALPQPSLDINLSQKIKDNWQISLRAENLLGSPENLIQKYKGEKYIYGRHFTGQVFTVSASYIIK